MAHSDQPLEISFGDLCSQVLGAEIILKEGDEGYGYLLQLSEEPRAHVEVTLVPQCLAVASLCFLVTVLAPLPIHVAVTCCGGLVV